MTLEGGECEDRADIGPESGYMDRPSAANEEGDGNTTAVNGWFNVTDAYDANRDNDSVGDGAANESSVVFRTNASRGLYNETGVWVAVDLNDTQNLTLFKFDAWVAINHSDVSAVTFRTNLTNGTVAVTTPEGYPVFQNASAGWVFIDLPGAADVRYTSVSSSYAPANATTNTTIAFYMNALRESLSWPLGRDGRQDNLAQRPRHGRAGQGAQPCLGGGGGTVAKIGSVPRTPG